MIDDAPCYKPDDYEPPPPSLRDRTLDVWVGARLRTATWLLNTALDGPRLLKSVAALLKSVAARLYPFFAYNEFLAEDIELDDALRKWEAE